MNSFDPYISRNVNIPINSTGQTISVNTLQTNDPNYTYFLNTISILGTSNDMVNITLNGIPMDLTGGMTYNFGVIDTVTLNRIMAINTSNSAYVAISGTSGTYGTVSKIPGIIIMGQKSARSIF